MNIRTVMIAASTVCGRISPAGFGSIKDRKLLESMRDMTDASLMGAGTLRDSDPEMRCSGGRLPEKRIRAFVSFSGNIPYENKKVFRNGPKPVIFVPCDRMDDLEERFNGIAEIKGISESAPGTGKGLSMSEIFRTLHETGAEKILVEGGGRLNYSCLREGLIDEILLTIAPFISGDRTAATVADSGYSGNSLNSDSLFSLVRLELMECSCSAETGEIFTGYRVIK